MLKHIIYKLPAGKKSFAKKPFPVLCGCSFPPTSVFPPICRSDLTSLLLFTRPANRHTSLKERPQLFSVTFKIHLSLIAHA